MYSTIVLSEKRVYSTSVRSSSRACTRLCASCSRPGFLTLPSCFEPAAPAPARERRAQGELADLDLSFSIGSVKLRAGMPLTELSPQLPQLKEEVVKLALELQEAQTNGRVINL